MLFVDSFGQETREPVVFDKLPMEHRMVGKVLITSFCDGVQFINMSSKDRVSVQLYCKGPHLVNSKMEKMELLFTCQDIASNNLIFVSGEELDLVV